MTSGGFEQKQSVLSDSELKNGLWSERPPRGMAVLPLLSRARCPQGGEHPRATKPEVCLGFCPGVIAFVFVLKENENKKKTIS